MDRSFSSRLFLVPLFQGLSRLDFLDMVEKTPFGFHTLAAGEQLVACGEVARSILIILGGKVVCQADSPTHQYTLSEHIAAPWVIQPDRLFGLHNCYTRTVRALSGDTQVVMLDKGEVRRLLFENPTFQINFYNMLSTIAQHTEGLLWQTRFDTPEARFKVFLSRRCLRPVGYKELHIRMTDLAGELGTSRLRVSQMLAAFARDGKLSYSRNTIVIPSLESL